MKFTTKTTQFKKILEVAKKALPKVSTLPVLNCVKITAEKSCINIKTTDMETSFSLIIKDVKVDQE